MYFNLKDVNAPNPSNVRLCNKLFHMFEDGRNFRGSVYEGVKWRGVGKFEKMRGKVTRMRGVKLE